MSPNLPVPLEARQVDGVAKLQYDVIPVFAVQLAVAPLNSGRFMGKEKCGHVDKKANVLVVRQGIGSGNTFSPNLSELANSDNVAVELRAIGCVRL